MDNDIYKPPESKLTQESTIADVIASRWDRLWASLIDGLIMLLIILPVLYVSGMFDSIVKGVQPSTGDNLLIGVTGIVAFIIINGLLLVRYGQTIGKKLMNIRIVDLDGKLPTIKKNLLPRYAIYFFTGHIPVVGQLLSMINILFIFSKQKRCVHDYIGATKVVFIRKANRI